MIQYFQLTPEILLEYIYEDKREPKLNDGNIKGNTKDIFDDETHTILLKSNAFSSKYLFFENEGLNSFPNLVLPLNNTETQFVVAKSEHQNFYSKINTSNIFLSKNGSEYIYENTDYDKNIRDKGESCDVKYDKCIIHFTSRNFFGNYESLIFQAYVYMSNKSKLYFASFLFKKKSDLELKAEHMLYNEKLYTTQIEFDIPSVYAIFANDNLDFNKALKSQNIELLENTPIGINVYGVTGYTKGTDNYERLKVIKINSISIPYIYNRWDEISVNISEAIDGDYYIIEPKMSEMYPTIVDYLNSMGESISSYIIMHELQLIEYPVDDENKIIGEKGIVTHKEYHIIDINENDEGELISERFGDKIKYRPICMYSSENFKACIKDTIKIINSVDGSSYEVTGSIDINNAHKYGKRLKRLAIKDESRPIVNVYNKKTTSLGTSSGDNSGSGAVILNKSGGFVIENMTQNITSFIECTNIGVSIVELSPDDIN